GFNVGHLNHVNFYVATMVLPWLLIAIDAFIKKPTLRRTAIMAAVAAVIPLSGQPQISLYTLLIGAIFGVISVVQDIAASGKHQRRGVKLATYILLAGLLAVSLASFAILPLIEFLPSTDRAPGLPEAELFEFSYPPSHAITLIMPYFFGNHTTYWGAKNFQELAAYVGPIPLLLALLALFQWKRNRPDRSYAIILILIGITFALGKYSPIYKYLIEHKYLTSLSVPGRFVFFFDFGVALLAAFGLHDIIGYLRKYRPAQNILSPFLVLLSSATLLAYGWNYNPLEPAYIAMAPSPFRATLEKYLVENKIPARLYAAETLPITGQYQSTLKPTEIISPAFTIIQPVTLENGVTCLQFPAQVETNKHGSIRLSLRESPDGPDLIIATLSSSQIVQHTNPHFCLPKGFTPPARNLYFTASSDNTSNIKLFYYSGGDKSVYFVRVPNPNSQQITQSQKNGRLFLESETGNPVDHDTALLMRHLHVTASTSSARWVGALSINPYLTFIEDFFANDREPFNGDGVHALAHNKSLVDMSGITHFTQAVSQNISHDAMVDSGYQLIQESPVNNKLVRLYKNPDAYPKTFLVENAIFEPDDTVVRYHLSQSNYQPKHLIYINGPIPPGNLDATNNQLAAGTAHITHYEPTRVDISVDTPNDTWLVLTDTWTPQWHTYLDGKTIIPYTANSVWRAAFVPAGQHNITFLYHSPAVSRSTKLTLSSLLIIIALIILPSSQIGKRLSRHPSNWLLKPNHKSQHTATTARLKTDLTPSVKFSANGLLGRLPSRWRLIAGQK
ncbi:MAG: YfhO family protein, partial [bacterium]